MGASSKPARGRMVGPNYNTNKQPKNRVHARTQEDMLSSSPLLLDPHSTSGLVEAVELVIRGYGELPLEAQAQAQAQALLFFSL